MINCHRIAPIGLVGIKPARLYFAASCIKLPLN